MEIHTLTMALLFVGCSVVLQTLILALFRKKQSHFIFTAAFALALVGFMGMQSRNSSVVVELVARWLLLAAHVLPIWGLRKFFAMDVGWTRRFSFYVGGSGVAALVSSLLGWDLFFSTIFSLFAMLVSWESIQLLRLQEKILSPIVYRVGVSALAVFVVMHVLRLALMAYSVAPAEVFANEPVMAFTRALYIIVLVFQGGFLSLLDGATVMSSMEQKTVALHSIANTDELTGLGNRHFLEAKMHAEIERSDRYSMPLSIIMIDLDHFKTVNDTWGHPVGDMVLVTLAQIVQEHIRDTDSLFRWGGEEFIVLAPHTDQAGAQSLAENLRNAIYRHPFPSVGQMSASFGAVERLLGEDTEPWFKRVDIALYRAKNNGRNQVVGWSDTDALPVSLVKMHWRREWECGNTLIDSEHRVLIQMANEILEVSLAESSQQTLVNHLNRMMAHIEEHFDDEELILEEVSYPEISHHVGLHHKLLEEANFFQRRLAEKNFDPSEFLTFLVGKLLMGHILMADTKFFPYLKKRPEQSSDLADHAMKSGDL